MEFGAKVNKLQIDGIHFIRKISFDDFNEGAQFKNTICKAQGLTKTEGNIAGADAVFATRMCLFNFYKTQKNPIT